MQVPRPEYPRPQFVRADWLCLNGSWQFEIDHADTGLERGLLNRPLKQKITVPFCPESELSGIGHTDYMAAVWYRKEVTIPKKWNGNRVLLHFQAVDYDATIWVNGREVTRHRGGFTPITADLSGVAWPGEKVTIVVRARDPHRTPMPSGKQSHQYANHACMYTRTTGIWQTVWMEPVSETYLQRPRITPYATHGCVRVELPIVGQRKGYHVQMALSDAEGVVDAAGTPADMDFTARLGVAIPPKRKRLWSPEDPYLYDLRIELTDPSGKTVDELASYVGMRSISIDGPAVKLNGKPVFQRLVLDQGYYPDGILTAPSDKALVGDIQLSMEAGFNGARLHQKIFEERFLYHADRMGYLVWGEYPDWGCNTMGVEGDNQQPTASYMTEWVEAIERDYSHPAIVGWCPLNETWQKLTDRLTQLDVITRGMFLVTKGMDTTRPVIDASGYSHRVLETDIYDCHDYEQDPGKFATNHAGLAEGKPFQNQGWNGVHPLNFPYRGQPFFVSEFGGIWWNPDAKPGEDSWGYGDRPKTLKEFHERFDKLCAVLLDNKLMFGYCYTQLTDVYQEQNGIYHFDRRPKFDMNKIRKSQERPAAIEAR